jgi:hypothetical protein
LWLRGDPVCVVHFLFSFLPSLGLCCAGSPDCGGVLEYRPIMRPMYATLCSYPSRVSPNESSPFILALRSNLIIPKLYIIEFSLIWSTLGIFECMVKSL